MKLRLLAALLIGMLLGGAVVNVLLGTQVDRVTLLNNSLQDELSSKENELKQLQENLATSRLQKISAIEVHVTIVPGKDIPELDQTKGRLTMENTVREWLQPLLGHEVSRLDHQLIPRVVDRRQVDVDGRKYVLQVNLVVVAEKTIVYINAVPQKNSYLVQ